MSNFLFIALALCMLVLVQSFTKLPHSKEVLSKTVLFSAKKGPRPLHKEFTVQKATPELLDELNVNSWGLWSTEDSSKYRVGVKSPIKVYDTNELSYIISGKMEIIDYETGASQLVQAGDFVTFPDGYACYWYVIETVVKRWYLYN